MLARSQQRAIHRPSHLALQTRHPLANSHHLALDKHLRAQGDRPQVRGVQRPADAQIIPEPGFGDQSQRHRGAVVE